MEELRRKNKEAATQMLLRIRSQLASQVSTYKITTPQVRNGTTKN